MYDLSIISRVLCCTRHTIADSGDESYFQAMKCNQNNSNIGKKLKIYNRNNWPYTTHKTKTNILTP